MNIGSAAIKDKYELLSKLGAGGFGEVWLVREKVTGAQLALKMISKDHPHWQAELAGLKRFRNTAMLHHHPHVLNLYEITESDDRFYYTMEAADNLCGTGDYSPDTLAARLSDADTPLPYDEICWYIFRLLEGIEVLHNAGLAHCDIKPENIIFVNGEPKLADIGLSSCKQDVSCSGTPGYLHPDGNQRSAQGSDFYAFGMTVFRMLGTGDIATPLPDLSVEEKRIRDFCHRVCSPKGVRHARELRNLLKKHHITDPASQRTGMCRRVKHTWIAAGLLFVLGIAGLISYSGQKLITPKPVITKTPAPQTSTKSKTSTRIRSFFSPDGGAEKAIIREIDKAERSIKIAVYYFTEKDFANALVAARERNVLIEVIVDRTQENRKDSMVPYLRSKGVLLYIDKKHRIMHNKFTVIDNETVITGSQNWTDSSEKRNAENTLIIHNNRYLAKKYLDTFEKLKEQSIQPASK